MDWPRIEAEALARNDRFLAEVVEGLSVCPYAHAARRAGRTARHVLPDVVTSTVPLEVSDGVRAAFEGMRKSPTVEVVQLIFPRAAVEAKTWVRSVKAVTAEVQCDLDTPLIAAAAFHPALEYGTASPAALVPLFRRSPDPLIQWIRLDALARVRAGRPDGDVALDGGVESLDDLQGSGRPPLDEQIAAANSALVNEMGLDAFEALLGGLRS